MVLLFDPPINTQDELSLTYQAIRSEYPTVTWISGTPLEEFDPLKLFSTYDSNGVYVIYFHPGQISISWSPYIDEYDIEKEKDDPYTYDGRQWVIDRLMGGVSTDDLFNQLNESIESGDYIIYEFDEPIDDETWQIIVHKLNQLYPNIKWSSGTRLDTKMFSKYDEIYGLRIQRQRNNYSLTCVDEPGWYSAHRYDNIHNGRELTTNYDETSSLFDQLNESDDESVYFFRFDPPLLSEEDFNNITKNIESFFPFLEWNSGDAVGVDYNTVSPNDINYGRGICGFKFFITKDNYKGGNIIRCYKMSNHTRYRRVYNGWDYVTNIDDTSRMFDQLNESYAPKYRSGQNLTPTRDLHYNRGGQRFMTMGKTYTINSVYVGDDYAEYDIGDDISDDHTFTESYLDNNFIVVDDYEETNNLFNQLNESEEDFDWVPKGPNLPTNIDEDFVIVISDPKEKMDIIEMVVNYMKQLGCEIDVYFLVMIGEKLKNSNPKLIYFRRTNFKGKGIGLAFGSNEEAYRMATHKRFIDSNTFYI